MQVEPKVSRAIKLAIAGRYSKIASKEWQKLLTGQDLDWPVLANYAHTIGLSPLLYDTVRETPNLAIPIETERFLKQSYHATATFNLFALHELSTVLDSMIPLKIPVVTLKGAALLLSVYNNFALRPMVDLDLLINFTDLKQTLETLADAGYLEQQPAPFHNYRGLFWNEVLLVGSGTSKMQVELHWNLVDNPYYARKLTTEKLMAHSRIKHAEGKELLLLAPDDQILHLCIHNTYHHRNLLERSFVDIAFTADQYANEIDWDRLVNTAIGNDMTRAVAINLTLAANEWFASIPAEILRQLGKPGIEFKERLFIISQRSEFLKLGRTLITVPGLKPKILFIVGQLFPTKEYLIWRYGNGTTNSTVVLYIRRYTSGLVGLICEFIGWPSWLRVRKSDKNA
jgi:hypothetical protein